MVFGTFSTILSIASLVGKHLGKK